MKSLIILILEDLKTNNKYFRKNTLYISVAYIFVEILTFITTVYILFQLFRDLSLIIDYLSALLAWIIIGHIMNFILSFKFVRYYVKSVVRFLIITISNYKGLFVFDLLKYFLYLLIFIFFGSLNFLYLNDIYNKLSTDISYFNYNTNNLNHFQVEQQNNIFIWDSTINFSENGGSHSQENLQEVNQRTPVSPTSALVNWVRRMNITLNRNRITTANADTGLNSLNLNTPSVNPSQMSLTSTLRDQNITWENITARHLYRNPQGQVHWNSIFTETGLLPSDVVYKLQSGLPANHISLSRKIVVNIPQDQKKIDIYIKLLREGVLSKAKYVKHQRILGIDYYKKETIRDITFAGLTYSLRTFMLEARFQHPQIIPEGTLVETKLGLATVQGGALHFDLYSLTDLFVDQERYRFSVYKKGIEIINNNVPAGSEVTAHAGVPGGPASVWHPFTNNLWISDNLILLLETIKETLSGLILLMVNLLNFFLDFFKSNSLKIGKNTAYCDSDNPWTTDNINIPTDVYVEGSYYINYGDSNLDLLINMLSSYHEIIILLIIICNYLLIKEYLLNSNLIRKKKKKYRVFNTFIENIKNNFINYKAIIYLIISILIIKGYFICEIYLNLNTLIWNYLFFENGDMLDQVKFFEFNILKGDLVISWIEIIILALLFIDLLFIMFNFYIFIWKKKIISGKILLLLCFIYILYGISEVWLLIDLKVDLPYYVYDYEKLHFIYK